MPILRADIFLFILLWLLFEDTLEFYMRMPCAMLEKAALQGTTHVHAFPRYTWYKLNEWMQVEILQIFGQSLETEPWYRFPYIQFMKVYFDVLFQESNIVQEKLGLKKAFGSMAFVTSLVPGFAEDCVPSGNVKFLWKMIIAY